MGIPVVRKILSISVYGRGRMYLKGVVKNVSLAGRIYPDYTPVIYCETGLPRDIMTALNQSKAIVNVMGKSLDHSGMLWRFLPAWDARNDFVIFRDADSRLNPREEAAVREWEKSGMQAHCMHDHKHHASYPIFGGMWGIRGGLLTGKSPLQDMWRKPLKRVGDMDFLRRTVQPLIEGRCLRHSSVKLPKSYGPYRPFPDHEPWEGFVGQQYDEKGSPISV
jgi:hypothetical protein